MTMKEQENKAQLLRNNETLTLNILINRFKRKEIKKMNKLYEEISDIMNNAIKEILDKTNGHKSAREYLIKNVCNMCIFALTNSKYKKKNDKITCFKKQADFYINDIDEAIEYYSYCSGE